MRTPLTAILLTLQHMDRQGVTPGDVRHHARMTSSTLRLNELVTGLLDYARFESGRLSAAPECLDLPDLAADVVEEIRVQARAKGLDLRLDASPGVPPITGDRRLLRLVVSNLVGNAVKYTPRGEVVVTVGHGPRGHVVAVRDTGPGIPEEDRGRVFEPFEQLEDVRHKSVPGVGLGLALVKRVVGSLGGDVSLEVPPEGGCVFTVVLPPSGAAGEDRDPFPVSMGSGP
ncbi:HAMP domain-containing histidine kinase [Myxococcota bacterium]|nr:HAMP domain-containing histidine kinase [Myxococcota bacterium]